jgi:hypothetical protein
MLLSLVVSVIVGSSQVAFTSTRSQTYTYAIQ